MEDYNLLLGIKSALGQKVVDINLMNNQTLIQTTQHGLININGIYFLLKYIILLI